jgi:phosphate uptake regulator
MELRKLQVTGGSTHVVSLPKKWVDRNGLRRSDTVAIHEEPDGSLLLIPRSEGRPEPRRITIQLPASAGPDEVTRRLVGAYVAGADEVIVRSAGKMAGPVRERVMALARDLVGVEVVEEGPGVVTLQDLVGIADLDLRKSLQRMHRIARMMYDDALVALQKADGAAATAIVRRDDELDRLLWMVSKQMHALLERPRLAARLNVRPAEALNLFLAARSLERIGDHAAKMAQNVVDLGARVPPKKVLADVTAQAEVVRALWEEAFTSLRRQDFEQASRAADLGEQAARWRSGFLATVQALDPAIVAPVVLIADSLDRTRGYAVDLAECAMNQTYQAASSEPR